MDKFTKWYMVKPYTIYRMVSLSMTFSDLWSRFQGHNIFWSRIS